MDQTNSIPYAGWPPRRVAVATLVVLAVAFVFWVIFRFQLVFFSLFFAIVLSTAIRPIVDRMSRWKIPPTVSIILISLFVLAMLSLLVLVMVPLISEQGATISNLLGEWYQGLYKTLHESTSVLVRRFAAYMPAFLPLSGPPATTTPTPPTDAAEAAKAASDMVQQALAFSGRLIQSTILFFSVLLLTGLWILEGDRATRFMMLGLPQSKRDPVRSFLDDMNLKVGAYMRGLVILATVIGVMAGIAYFIIGLPNVLLLAVIAGIMEIVPLIGPLLGAIPAVLVAAAVAPDKVIWVIAAYTVVQMAENQFIVPRVMDRAVGVNPVVSLLAFIAFGSIFGFLGALLAIPLAAVIQLVLNRLVFDANPMEQIPPTGRGNISTLRYEAQNLALDVRKQVREKEAELSAREDHMEDALEAIAQDLDSILAQLEAEEVTNQNGNGNGNGKGAQ